MYTKMCVSYIVVRIPIRRSSHLHCSLLVSIFVPLFSFAYCRPEACSCVQCTGVASDENRGVYVYCCCERLEESAQIGARRAHGKYNILIGFIFDGHVEPYFDCNTQTHSRVLQ